MVDKVAVVVGLALLLGGCSDWSDAVASRAEAAPAERAVTEAVAAPAVFDPSKPAFPLAGIWIWANGNHRLPSRDVGCGYSQGHMAISEQAFRVEREPWAHDAFTVTGWRPLVGGRTELRLDEATGAGRRRIRAVVVDEPPFLRLVSAEIVDERAPAAGVDASAPRRMDQAQGIAELAAMFPLRNCHPMATTAMLRGATADATWEIRR